MTGDANPLASKYGPEVQKVAADTPLEDILYLLKRDGGVFVRGMVSLEDVDQAYAECKDTLDSNGEWTGSFFPKETKRATAMLKLSPTYARTQMMHPLFQAVSDHFLTTRTTNWWGNEQKESVSKPYVHSCTAMRIGPGGKAQPLHRDDYINHNLHTEVEEWDDERDMRRETALGLFVAGSKVTKENGGTQFIPRSHLWGSSRGPPRVEDCIFAEMEKGDGFFMLASAFHGGGHNTSEDSYRTVYATFAVRGHLRQEENQYLAVPQEIARQYDAATQAFMGYSMAEPACGYVDETDPIFVLRPELKKGPSDY